MNVTIKEIGISFLFLCLISLTTIAYWPGLAGPFLFDDFANLPALGKYGGIRDWESLLLYLFSGISGPTGRPISLASFLLNDVGWPSDPWSFKYTNLMLHLLTGTLLFTLLLKLLRITRTDFNLSNTLISLMVAGIWLLHPLNVSTVLYPVQRMTILAALFVILGLVGYIHGRHLLSTKPHSGYIWMSTSLVICTLLATLSKENGALLPMLALTLEVTTLRSRNSITPLADKRWSALFLWLPSLLIIGYLLYPIIDGSLINRFARRPFTLIERVLTEPRVLFDYLYYWFIPHIDSPGLLTQDFPLSKTLFDPLSTLASIISLIALIALAIAIRKKQPYLSLAILFYFTGHIIESSVVPLEIYFEHRNYLPSIFLVAPIGLGLAALINKRKAWLLVPILFIGLSSALTAERVRVWSDELSLALQWAQIHPFSQRAQRNASQVAEKRGAIGLSMYIMDSAVQRLPENPILRTHHLVLKCKYQSATPQEVKDLIHSYRTDPFDFRALKLLRTSMLFMASSGCRGITVNDTFSMLEALSHNPKAKSTQPKRLLLHVKGILWLFQKQADKAQILFEESLNLYPDVETGLQQTALLASSGYYSAALLHINLTEHLLRSHPEQQGLDTLDYANEINIMRDQIIKDLQAKSAL